MVTRAHMIQKSKFNKVLGLGAARSPFRRVVLPLRLGNAEKQEDLPLQAS